MKKQTRNLLIKIAGSLVILFVLFRLIDFDPQSFKTILLGLDLTYYLLSLFGVLAVLAIKSIRWQQIVKNEGFYYQARKAFGAYMASFTIGVITPGRIGEIARLYYLRQDCEIDFVPSFRTIVTDRIFDLGVLVMLAVAGLFYYTGLLGEYVYLSVIVGVIIFFAGLFLSLGVIGLLKGIEKFQGIKSLILLNAVLNKLLMAVH